jgi:hypothetical protein
MGGTVTYLVQTDSVPPGLAPVDPGVEAAVLTDDPRRAPWARPGGPAADLAWAAAQVTLTGRPEQVRSWNLSAIWRLPTAEGFAWLKCVPPFFAHEAAVLRAWGAGAPVPRLLASDAHRMLLVGMPGHDGYDASTDDFRAVIDTLVDLQTGRPETVSALRAAVPWWSPQMIADGVRRAVAGRAARWPRVTALMDDWESWAAAVDECGVPDTLFHGDLHPGNARLGIPDPILFDWGDSGYGHPLLDLAVLERYELVEQEQLLGHWLERWRGAVPGSDPARAWALLRPVALARAAAVFRMFLDNIERSEAPYHEGDVDPALDAAEAALAPS